MINKKYLRFLFHRFRIALLFFLLLYLFLLFLTVRTDSQYDLYTSASEIFSYYAWVPVDVSIACTYLLPLFLFSYVHRLKSVDVYFALPFSRTQQLWTTVFFAFLVSACFFFLGTIMIFGMLNPPFSWLVIVEECLMALFGLLVLVCLNSSLYLLANNVADGVIMVLFYTLLPLFLNLVVNTFCSDMVIFNGSNEILSLDRTGKYLTPVYMAAANTIALVDFRSDHLSFHWSYLVSLAVFLGVCLRVLKVQYVDRKTERAEHVSDGFFAYPFLIGCYTVLVLMLCSLSLLNTSEGDIFPLTYFVIVFGIYTVAQFIYRRKITFRLKPNLFFAISLILSVILCVSGFRTHLFGIGDKMPQIKADTVQYSYEAYVSPDDLGEPGTYMTDGQQLALVSFDLPVQKDSSEEYLLPLLEQYYQKNAQAYYDRADQTYSYGMFFKATGVSRKVTENGSSASSYSDTQNWSFTPYYAMSVEDLKTVSQYTTVKVYPDEQSSEYYTLDQYLQMNQ